MLEILDLYEKRAGKTMWRAKLIYGIKNSPAYIPMLFYTCANKKMYDYAILYPLFALLSNPYASVEICVDDKDAFIKEYSHLIFYYDEIFPGRVIYSYAAFGTILPNSVRFLVQPFNEAKYIYIGDVDIIVLDEEILHKHIKNIKYHNLDYSNIKRYYADQLSGLHFIEYNKMFPIKAEELRGITDNTNDEDVLFSLMRHKGFNVPNSTYRPVHGLHISFNRPPLPTLTTRDAVQSYVPPWHYWHEHAEGGASYAHRYLEIRYTEAVRAFMQMIRPQNVSLRRTVQFIDMFCHYIVDHVYSNDFDAIYQHNGFEGSESVSGPGSSLAATEKMRAGLSEMLANYAIHSILDIPCGDCNWMSTMDLHGIDYIGGDISGNVIEANKKKYGGFQFESCDLRFDALPDADLLICRDCFIHLPIADIILCLQNIKRSNITYCLLSTYYSRNENIELTGLFRPVNLLCEPFNFPKPLMMIHERAKPDNYFDKVLALWKVIDIPKTRFIAC